MSGSSWISRTTGPGSSGRGHTLQAGMSIWRSSRRARRGRATRKGTIRPGRCAASGLSGYQIRGVSYRGQDEMYHAAQEFAWNPALTEEGFARLHIIRRYHRDDEVLARLYASWIKLNGHREAPDAVGWVDRDRERSALREERIRFETVLGAADRDDEFVADIAGAFEENRREFIEEE